MSNKKEELNVKDLKKIAKNDSGLREYEAFLDKIPETEGIDQGFLDFEAEIKKKYADLLK